ncbi:MAG TPA: PhaM family polyhydroxyalkanoate granule multifunctional regulatory protein [Ideonella sp.]|nr:PhaM family polyhydroxyalkanoate granule multifunctional regulatory protein [Ideonella sp.]
MAESFGKFVPGFDFLQDLVKNAGAALPNIGQWVAPTLDPDELEKRIEELRTVQFWLEQNAKMLGATIQALEVQRMTLSALKTMNVQMDDLRESLKIHLPGGESAAPPPAEAAKESPPKPAKKAAAKKKPAAAEAAPSLASGIVDPMQWWGALTKQFTQLAAGAMKDGAADAAKNLAGSVVDAAGETLRQAAGVPAKVARQAVQASARAAAPRKRAVRT